MKKLLIILLLAAAVFTVTAKVTKRTESSSTGIQGLKSQKIITETNYKADGSGDWLKPNTAFQFATTNGKGCKITADKSRSSLRNCKITYSSTYANKAGRWSSPGIVIEALGEGSYSYNLSYKVEWRD